MCGADASARYPDQIQAVSADEILKVAQALLEPSREIAALVAPDGVEL